MYTLKEGIFMRLILTQEVKKVGKKGEVVNVAEGYGRNFLIPRGLAVEANETNMRSLQHEKSVKEEKQKKEERDAHALAERLSGLTVTIKAKTGEGGRLFGSVTAQDVADAISSAASLTIDKRRIEMADPIKSLGQYLIPVKVYQGVSAEVTVKVITE
jgi:large subunit ribosomal protein L9